ncbi:MAG: hypothetical protein JWP87_1241 [Labilithrix sp.]|jgi:DNA-binding beta-propeller fold protein YncE|nr:hypothetical protein [Labilithrix sp.]
MRSLHHLVTLVSGALLATLIACSPAATSSPPASSGGPPGGADAGGGGGSGNDPEAGAVAGLGLPLVFVADVDLPGKSNRFDYQDIDVARGLLVIAHMNDAAVVVVDLKDGALKKLLPGIPTARGVVAADDVGRIFVTSSPNQLVIIDNTSLSELTRVTTGSGPDGVGWDPVHKVVGVSDQGDGAISLIPNSGNGTRVQVKLGSATGNVVFDPTRAQFWVTVESARPPDQLVAVDPVAGSIATRIDLPGCDAAHGLRLHPDGKSAFVACEGNSMMARVDLEGAHAVVIAATGDGPDVLGIDPGLGWLYVAAESGDLTVFDIGKPGLVAIDREHPGEHAHSVSVDAATHRVFFPLMAGPKGTPVLRIMKPSGT